MAVSASVKCAYKTHEHIPISGYIYIYKGAWNMHEIWDMLGIVIVLISSIGHFRTSEPIVISGWVKDEREHERNSISVGCVR